MTQAGPDAATATSAATATTTARRQAARPTRRDAGQTFWRDAAMPFVDSRRACHSRACYRPHSHPTFSIGAVDAGASVFTGAAHAQVALQPGTLVFVPAQRVHACNPAADADWSYQMLHLDADWLQAVRQEYAPALTSRDEPVRIVNDPALYAHFCRVNALLFSGAGRDDKEAAIIEFIGQCDDAAQTLHIAPPSLPAHMAGQLQPVLEHLNRAPIASQPLDALARIAGMSRYRLLRAFRTLTGMTPHAWQLNQRIALARQRLLDGDNLAALAQHLGFADQAHFQRVFKAHAGVTPGQFRT